MPTLTRYQIEDARAVLKALQAALAKVDGAGPIILPDVPPIDVTIGDVPPSASIAQAVAASRRARNAFEAETEARRLAALVIAVLAEVGRAALGPAIGLLVAL
jgi:hypothetical protein